MGLPVEERIMALAQPVAEGLGLEIWSVELRRDRGGAHLLIVADRPGGGIGFDDLTSLSRELSVLFDVEDPISSRYNLEVSSPGLTRLLKKWEDWIRAVGRMVVVVLHEPLAGKNKIRGRIEAAVDGQITLLPDTGEEALILGFGAVAKAKLDLD